MSTPAPTPEERRAAILRQLNPLLAAWGIEDAARRRDYLRDLSEHAKRHGFVDAMRWITELSRRMAP